MIALLIGIVLAALKVLGVEPIANLSWIWILIPFGLAILWFSVIVPVFKLDRQKSIQKKKNREQELRNERLRSMGLTDSKQDSNKRRRR